MGSHEKTGIVQFCGVNFENWSFWVEKQLAASGCLEAVKSTPPSTGTAAALEQWNKIDMKAQDILTSVLH